MVSVPPSLTPEKKRIRRFFSSLPKAKEFAGKLRSRHQSGERGGLIPMALALQAVEAEKILNGSGLSIVEAARIALAHASNPADLETYEERWQRAMLHGEMTWSDVYAVSMGKIPRWVGPEVMAMKCGALNKGILKAAIELNGTTNAGTVKMKLLRAMAILGDKERRSEKKPDTEILTVHQSARLLRVCERPEERWAVSVLLFAGIRPSVDAGEISRLQWEAFGPSEIYVSTDVSKTPSDRHIPITPRLARLIRGHPEKGPVMPSGWKRAWTRIRKAAGISDLNDVTRHTFGSNFLAAFGENDTKQAMGHTEGSRTLFVYYRKAVTKAAGTRFFR